MKRFYLLDMLWLICLSVYIIIGTNIVPFHGDESTLLFMNRDYDYQFIERDLAKIYYADPPLDQTEQELRLLNGTLYKYVVGFARQLRGIGIEGLNEVWDWGADFSYNIQTNRYPSDDLLMTARYALVPFLALGMVALFFICKNLGGRLPAYIASAYFALSPALLLNGRRAMMESLHVGFALMTVLCAVYWLKRPTSRNAIFLGACAGLAIVAKHPVLFTLVPVFLVCGIVALIPKNRILRLSQVLVAGILVILIFFVMNVAWWSNPLDAVRDVLHLRADLLALQIDLFGGYTDFAHQLRGFWEQVFIAQPQFYEVADWGAYIGDSIMRYQSSAWAGIAIGGNSILAIALAVLVIIGIWDCLRKNSAVHWLIVVWGIFQFITSVLLTPLEWQRYYLMTYPPVGIFTALGMMWLLRHIMPQQTDLAQRE